MQNSTTIIAGKYEIGKEIGKGGMSQVYLATDTRLNKVWAVKKVDKNSTHPNRDLFIKNLRREVKLMEGLSYATIPRIVDIIEDSQNIYIVMDYVEGEGLDKMLKIQGKQNEEDVIDWAKQLCETLIYLHSLNHPVVHRDIKPANIILQPGVQNAIKILDFGIAETITPNNSRNMNPVGTPGYMPPEQRTKGVPYDIRSDIYAFGATLHHLLTGRIPKEGKEFVKLRAITGRVSDNTEGLEHVIDKCLKSNPNERYQDCNELLYDLNHLTELSNEHRRKLLNRTITFFITFSMCLIFVFSSVFCNLGYRNLVKKNQNTYANNIYSLSNEVLEDYKKDSTDFITIYYRILDIEDALQTSKKLSGNKYSNALVFSAYSISMWNINDTIQFSLSPSNKLDEENTEAYKNCKAIFEHDFINHLGSFASNLSSCSDSKEVAICICEMNAFNILFNSTSENSALGLLQSTNKFIDENGFSRNLSLEESFSNSFSEFINNDGYYFYETEIKNKGFGDDLVDTLSDFAVANSSANSSLESDKTHEPTNEEKQTAVSNCLEQYANVVKVVSDTNLNHYYKFLLYSNAANYLDHNVKTFKSYGISQKVLTGEGSLYYELDEAINALIDSSSDNAFIKQCENINLKGIYGNINSTYKPTSSKNK